MRFGYFEGSDYMMPKTLDEIAITHGTDKATSHPLVNDGKGHGYTPVYDRFFTPLRKAPIKFLEIGVGGGESIRTWLEYFPKAKVFGVDIVHGTNPWNTVIPTDANELMNFPLMPVPSRYRFVTGDQSDDTFWECFKADYGTDWDVVIDDGGHASNQIITTFKHLWPILKPGGLYCIEDLNCAYAGISGFCPEGFQNHMDFLKDMLDQINRGQNDIESFNYTCELAILRKR